MGFLECPMCRRAVVDDRDAVSKHAMRDHSMWEVARLLWRVDPVFLLKQVSIVGLAVFGTLLALTLLWRR